MTDLPSDSAARDALVMHGRSLFERGYSCGSSGNLSVRLADGFLVTPTNSCLGRLDPGRISRLDPDGGHTDGDPPSKEAVLHLAVYAARPDAGAVIHLHSPHAVAVSCLAMVNRKNALPPLTPYYVMRVGRLPLVPYVRPGHPDLAAAVGRAAAEASSVLMANHGPVCAGASLDQAVYAAEELEETARLFILLQGQKVRLLEGTQVAELDAAFPR